MARKGYIPEPDGLNAEFYARAQDGTLHLQACAACGALRHPPRHACARCGSMESEWRTSPGRGRLYSWTVTHFPYDRGWAEETPYATGIVELDEGVRLVGHLDVPDPAALEIGLRLAVELTPMGESFAFLTFRPEGATND